MACRHLEYDSNGFTSCRYYDEYDIEECSSECPFYAGEEEEG